MKFKIIGKEKGRRFERGEKGDNLEVRAWQVSLANLLNSIFITSIVQTCSLFKTTILFFI